MGNLKDQKRNPGKDVRRALGLAGESEPGSANALTQVVKQAVECLHSGNLEELRSLVANIHSADLADVIGLIEGADRQHFIEIIKDNLDPEVLSELEGQAFDDVIEAMEPEDIAEAVTRLESDDAIEVLEEMEPEEQQEVLEKISADDRVALEEGLAYPEDSAGRLMQRKLIAVPPYWTVGQTIDHLRERSDLPKDFWEIFVVDATYKPVGTLPLSWIMRSGRATKIEDIMKVEQTLVPVEQDQEEVAHLFGQYNLVSAAVVDGAGRLVGMITVDDVVDVIEEEAEEDILALAGVFEGDVSGSFISISRARVGWLVVNLGTAILASLVISFFGATIEQLVALAVLMPIVASMGGNAATQTMAVTVRALATHELTAANARKIVGKEFLASLLNGIILATMTGVVAALWFQNTDLGLVIAAAMVINMLVAGLSGILVPMTLVKARIDPAVASTVFVTTITDVVGFFAFLGLATWFLV